MRLKASQQISMVLPIASFMAISKTYAYAITNNKLSVVSDEQLRARIDYAYTIQGWLKAMNTDTLATKADMGLDGGSTSITARDAVAHTIDYFAGDYQSIALSGRQLQHIAVPVIRSLYNGNIARQTVAIDNFQKLNKQYVYDQLNRITRADYATVDPASGGLTGISDFHSKYTYDPDGNIQTLLRYGNNTGSGAQQMDSLNYQYQSTTNDKLADVLDAAPNVYTNDLQQHPTPGAPRYTYDAIGNTTADLVSGQTSIQWNLYNKVTTATNPADASTLQFDYDGTGNRVGKHYAKTSATDVKVRDEYYVHDAAGNILATYKGNSTVPTTGGSQRSFALAEHNINGGGRLGIKQYYGLELGTSSDSTGPTPVYDTFRFYSRAPWYSLDYQDVIKLDSTNLYGNALTDMYFAHHTVGQRQYELTDHLGNVLATISDKHAADSFAAIGGGGLLVGNDANISAWKPIVISAHDYYPFGEYMPGRYRTDLAANCMTATLPTLVPGIYSQYVPIIPLPGAVTPHGTCGVYVTSTSSVVSGAPPTPYPMLYLSTTGAGSGGDLAQYIAAGGASVAVDVYSLSGQDTFMIKDDAGAIIGLNVVTSAIPAPGTTITIPITVVPHSNNVKVCVSALTATSSVIISGIHIPRDTTTTYNIVSNVCNNDFYRFGFNGQMKDNEWAGLGNHLEFKFRGYDSRIGRFLCADPLFKQYPWNSAYAFAENDVIRCLDIEGLEKAIYSVTRTQVGKTTIKTVTMKTLETPGPLGSGVAVILNKDGVTKYMYGEISKDNKDFVTHYEGREDEVYPSVEGGAPTGGIGHKLTNAAEKKQYPVGTQLTGETIDNWFEKDWSTKSGIVENNSSTSDNKPLSILLKSISMR